MGKNLVLGAAIGALAFAYGCSGSGSTGSTTAYSVEDFSYPLTSTDVAGGSEVYAEFCEGCHPGGEQGDGPRISGEMESPAEMRWRIRTGGKDMPPGLHSGAYVQPTIFADVSNDMTIAKEEIFGPVLCMIVYDEIEAAIEMANDTVYGLASAVYARDKAAALKIARRIRAGQCYIQGRYFNLEAPFGGFKQSGNGREWGDQAMHEYIEIKAVIA